MFRIFQCGYQHKQTTLSPPFSVIFLIRLFFLKNYWILIQEVIQLCNWDDSCWFKIIQWFILVSHFNYSSVHSFHRSFIQQLLGHYLAGVVLTSGNSSNGDTTNRFPDQHYTVIFDFQVQKNKVISLKCLGVIYSIIS